ncbi:nucleotidyltransferase family protein [Marinihelvus fidelis]|uniref:nucleotidyltransferase family protein n=1 Tax=Marinihelvus fidelis TaxID=2613842 RepID=UPI0017810993|nr:nucleotidyltransferase family protein [Marinihelvus fidelis]
MELAHIDSPELVFFAIHQGVAALLDQRLADDAATGLSENSRRALRDEARRDAAMDLALNDTLQKCWQILKNNGIDALLLKGAALARTVYPHSRLRPRCDTDIWVRQSDAPRLIGTFRDAGYTLVNDDLETRSRKQFQATREQFQGAALWFDVHHRLSNRLHFMDALDFDDCLGSAVPVTNPEQPPFDGTGTIAGQRMVTLSDPKQLLHLCIHRIAHGRNRESQRLIWLYDIHLLFGQMSSTGREGFLELALSRGLGCICGDALQACQDAFGLEINAMYLDALTARRKQEPTARLANASPWRWAWADFSGQSGWRAKWQFLAEVAHNRLRR